PRGPVENPLPGADPSGRAHGLLGTLRQPGQKAFQSRGLVREDRDLPALRGRERTLLLQEALALALQGGDAALLLAGARVEPVGLELQRLLPREPGLETDLGAPMLGQQPRVASRERVEKRDALYECRHVARFQQDPHVAEPTEAVEEAGPREQSPAAGGARPLRRPALASRFP